MMTRFLVGLAAGIAALAAARQAAAGTELYVSAEESGEIIVVDAERGEVAARVPVGKRPRGIKLSHDGKLLYVALSGIAAGGAGRRRIEAAAARSRGRRRRRRRSRRRTSCVRTYASGQDPESFDLSRDGKTLYVSNEESSEMSVLDLETGKVTRKVAVGGEPEGVTLRPDGKAVYVTSEQDNQVVAIDTRKLSVMARIPTGPRPRAIAFSRDGKTGFVTCENGGGITVFDAVEERRAPARSRSSPSPRRRSARGRWARRCRPTANTSTCRTAAVNRSRSSTSPAARSRA